MTDTAFGERVLNKATMTMRKISSRAAALPLGALALIGACRGERGQRQQSQGEVAVAATAAPPKFTTVSDQMLLSAGSDSGNGVNWMMYGGGYNNQRYSPLDQINKGNVTALQLAWTYQTGVPKSFETTPLVVNGIMYMTTPDSKVIALNAATGQQLWRYEPNLGTTIICCGPNNRGVAVYGDKVYVATLDDRLIALSQRNGSVAWQTPIDDPSAGYSQTMAPLVADGKVIIGTAGAEYGIRGYIKAFDPNDGKLVWTFYTIPAPGEAPNGWWGQWKETDPFGTTLHRNILQERSDSARYADAWKRGGGSVWMTPAYDPETKTLYAGVGNPSPDLDGKIRPGDNLYCESLVAVDVTTGHLKWYVQLVPHDVWDLDAASPPVLFVRNGRKLIGHAGKTGWYYVIDATTGTPVLRSQNFVPQENMFAQPTAQGVRMLPGANGGAEWSPTAYSPRTALTYVLGLHQPMNYSTTSVAYTKGRLWLGSAFKAIPGEEQWGTFTAINVDDGNIAWQRRVSDPMIGGPLATAGDVVFVGEANGSFDAFDAGNGALLWRFNAGAGVNAAPMTYSVGGVQYIAVAAGGNFQIGSRIGDNLYVFALRNRLPQQPPQYQTPAYARGTAQRFGGATRKATADSGLAAGDTRAQATSSASDGAIASPSPSSGPSEVNPTGNGAPNVDPSDVAAAMQWDAATKSMTLPMVAALTKTGGGWNFDGYASGKMTITVKVGTRITMPFYNEDIVPHSLGVVTGSATNIPSAPTELAFPQASTTSFQQGIGTNQSDTAVFTADKAGTYLIVCGVPGHAASGMWVVLQVTPNAKRPRITTK